VHTIFLVKSLGWFLISLVKIYNLPSLVGCILSLSNKNFLTFNIFVSSDFEALMVSDIAEVLSLVKEDLIPS
jgi:hypothetical protein